MPTDGKIKWGFQYTPQDPYDFDEISEHPIINAKVNGEDRKLVVHAARNGFFYALDRTNGSFVAGKQYVDQLTWTTGLDPKTGKPLNYDPNSDIQIYTPWGKLAACAASGGTHLPDNGGKNGSRPLIRSSACCTSRRSKAATSSRRSSRRTSPTRRHGEAARALTGGSTKNAERRYGSLKAVDPTTGETKANLRLTYATYGALATAVFLGHYDGNVTAHDAKTLQELWSFNIGTCALMPVPMLKVHTSARVLASCAEIVPS